jgi:hypothetical protein
MAGKSLGEKLVLDCAGILNMTLVAEAPGWRHADVAQLQCAHCLRTIQRSWAATRHTHRDPQKHRSALLCAVLNVLGSCTQCSQQRHQCRHVQCWTAVLCMNGFIQHSAAVVVEHTTYMRAAFAMVNVLTPLTSKKCADWGPAHNIGSRGTNAGMQVWDSYSAHTVSTPHKAAGLWWNTPT